MATQQTFQLFTHNIRRYHFISQWINSMTVFVDTESNKGKSLLVFVKKHVRMKTIHSYTADIEIV